MPAKRQRSDPAESGAASSAVSWTAPTVEEFKQLKRYKSFLLPPNNSYVVNQYVWLAHEANLVNTGNGTTSSQTPKKKARPSTLNSKDSEPLSDPPIKGPLDKIHEEEFSDPNWDAQLWIGKIVEIRARDTSFVWMKIRWVCRTINELRDSGVRSGLPRSKAGPKEIYMLGEEHDALQPVGAVEGSAPVIVFDERNPVQAPFGYNHIFLRSEARTPTEAEAAIISKKRIAGNVEPKSKKKSRASETGPSGHLFPLRSPTCYCGDPYRPLSDREEPMALCAHSSCLRWFHLGCLDWKKDHRRTATSSFIENVRSSGLELMSLIPEYGLTTPATEIPLDQDPGEIDITKLGTNKDKPLIVKRITKDENGHSENTNLNEHGESNGNVIELDTKTLEKNKSFDDFLPEIVIAVADSPIIRGTSDTGIVGNARYILRAREIISENRKIRNVPKVDSSEIKRIGKMVEEFRKIWEIPEEDENVMTEINNGKDKDNENGKGKENGKENGEVEEDENVIKGRAVVWLCPNCRRAM